MAKIEAPRKKTTMLAPASVRERQTSSGISGRLDRRPSMTRKTPISARPAPIAPSVSAEPQPFTSVRTMP
jgi:hypothetical protein